MIEFRWIEKGWKLNRGGYRVKEKLLQFRCWELRMDASGAITLTPLPITWTKWKTVPTIRSNVEPT